MLPCTRLRDNPGLAHISGKKRMANTVVHFVGTRVIQVFPFEPNLSAAVSLRQPLRVIKG